MISRTHITILTIAFCFANIVTSFGQFQTKKARQITKNKAKSKIQFDTSKIAIIPFDRKYGYPFDSSYQAATLTQDDINTIDSLLNACVTDYNSSLDKDHKGWSIDLEKK